MAFESDGGQRFPYTYEQVFSGLLQVLPCNGFKVKKQDKDLGRIECSSGMSMMSFGENLTLTVEAIDKVSTRINVHSALKIQGNRGALFTGEGKNSKNVNVIVSALAAYLKTQEKPELPAEPPQPMMAAPPSKPLSFYIFLNEQVKGPFSLIQIQGFLQLNSAARTTPCCPEGTEDWKTIGDFL